MKKICLVLSLPFLLFGCGMATSARISAITGDRYVSQDLEAVLADIERQDIHCVRSTREETDERLKALTDGTLQEVRFYHCCTESDSLAGVSRRMTFLVAQYGKVLRVHGNVDASSYVWE